MLQTCFLFTSLERELCKERLRCVPEGERQGVGSRSGLGEARQAALTLVRFCLVLTRL